MRIRNIAALLILLYTLLLPAQSNRIEKWGIFELQLQGSEAGNPFIGVEFSAVFRNGDSVYESDGFYDGNGIYKIRFMPGKEGLWTYETISNKEELDGQKGQFICIPPNKKNRGPMRIRNKYHFAYEDGTPFYPFGTTLYEWAFQPRERQERTLKTLQSSPFNKVRFLLVPPYKERYISGPEALDTFPFPGTSKENWDFSRFNTVYFQQFEEKIVHLLDMGIEADLILFRPYDNGKWGFDRMDAETNDRFLRYVVARFAAYRNVWWCLANENSFMRHLTTADWDRLFQIVQEKDPYQHLRSIHNAGILYDYTKPWVTHVSLQYYNAVREFGASTLVRDIYRKPVVHDEINYEGNIAKRWGQLTGEEMVYRFWLAYIGGTYASHGEAIQHESDIDWISEGGLLRGKSPSRIAFLRHIVESGPDEGLEPLDHYYLRNVAGKYGEYYLYYFGKETPKEWEFKLPDEALKEGEKFQLELIDTWNMTISPVKGIFEVVRLNNYEYCDKNKSRIKMSGKPYMAIRIRKIE